MTPTDYEIARLAACAFLLFALLCIPAALIERKQEDSQ